METKQRGIGMRQQRGKVSRESPVFAGRRGIFAILVSALISAARLASPGDASAVTGTVKDGMIEDVPGVRFENMFYTWNSLSIDVVNTTDRNMTFGGVMTFLDRRGRPVARVRLLPKKIVRDTAERYKGFFAEGTGETARRASRILWDFGPR
jgi:hypothetical protein